MGYIGNSPANVGTSTCIKCAEVKPTSEFHKNTTYTNGLDGRCKTCKKAAHKANYVVNKKTILAKNKAWQTNSPEKYKIVQERFRTNNPEKFAAKAAKRRYLYNASSINLNQSQKVEIEYMYMYNHIMPGAWEVDHIVPLNGKNICGLHIPENLQVISHKENRMKTNKFKEAA